MVRYRYVRPVLGGHRPVVHLDQNLLMVEEMLISYVVSSLNHQEKFSLLFEVFITLSYNLLFAQDHIFMIFSLIPGAVSAGAVSI